MRAPAHIGAISLCFLSACFAPSNGIDPPLDRIYFPTGLALSEPQAPDQKQFLFVVSSDFDLQYNGGALASYDLGTLAALVPAPCSADLDCTEGRVCDVTSSDLNGKVPSHFCVAPDGPNAGLPCGAFGEQSPADRSLYPGRCKAIDPTSNSIVVDQVGIGAFATDAIFRSRPASFLDPSLDEVGRLFVPVRGDATLHWISVGADGRLDCGQQNNDGACDDGHRAGKNPDDNSRQLRQQSEPFELDATEDGRAVVVTNQTSGSLSLFVNDWDAVTLEFVLGGLVSGRPVGVAAVPKPKLASADYDPGFLVVYRDVAQIDLIRFFDDAEAGGFPRPFLFNAGGAAIGTNSIGTDSRGIAIDASERSQAEAACALEDSACVQRAAAIMPRVFVSNRAPSTLLVGALQPTYDQAGTNDLPAFTGSVPLTFGPSRVVLGRVRVRARSDLDLGLEMRVFVVCFDSRRIFVYDPARRLVESVITTGRGPHALVVDEARALAYVGHFTDSFIGVISLDQRFPETYATMIANVGQPSPPRASK